MPELPEVETVKLGLERLIVGKKITNLDFDWPKSFQAAQADVSSFLIGAVVTGVSRRAKVLIIGLSTGYSLVIHLKMTGQLVYRGTENFGAGHPNASLIGSLPDKSTRVTFDLGDAKLFFNDQRKFGWIKLMPNEAVFELPFMQKVGPEPLEAAFSFGLFKGRLQKRSKSTIKAALLDQSVIAGIGNIYADESLWGAKINPNTKVVEISDSQLKTLHKEIISILKLSISKGGSTNRNYVNAEGNGGSFMSFARVFRRDNQPCPRCNEIIKKTRVAARGTHYCPKCQGKI